YFFLQAEDGIRDRNVTGVQTCALPIYVYTIRCALYNDSLFQLPSSYPDLFFPLIDLLIFLYFPYTPPPNVPHMCEWRKNLNNRPTCPVLRCVLFCPLPQSRGLPYSNVSCFASLFVLI